MTSSKEDPAENAASDGRSEPHIRTVRFHFPATLDDVAAVSQTLRAFIVKWVPEEVCNSIELGVAEALTNVVTHGYAGIPHAAVEMAVEEFPAKVLVRVFDSGRPIPEQVIADAGRHTFDFDVTDLDNLPIGGMGLSLIKASFDTIHYETRDGINCLVLGKRLGAPPGSGDIPPSAG